MMSAGFPLTLPPVFCFFFFKLIIILFSTPTPSWLHFLSILYRSLKFFANDWHPPMWPSEILRVHSIKKSPWGLHLQSLDPVPSLLGHMCLRCPCHHLRITSVSHNAGFVSWVLCLVLTSSDHTHTPMQAYTHPFWCSTASVTPEKGVWEVENFHLPITESDFICSAPWWLFGWVENSRLEILSLRFLKRNPLPSYVWKFWGEVQKHSAFVTLSLLTRFPFSLQVRSWYLRNFTVMFLDVDLFLLSVLGLSKHFQLGNPCPFILENFVNYFVVISLLVSLLS